MADTQGEKMAHAGIDPAKKFYVDIPQQVEKFHVKGAHNADWGMKSRLSRIFNRESGHTLMLAFDHGYITGASTGLERMDLLIPQLIEDIDVLMANRGALRTCVPASYNKGVALRCSTSTTVLSDDVTTEMLGVDIKDAIRMDASCMAVQTFLGTPDEFRSLSNLSNLINLGVEYGIPVLGVVAVGKQMARTPHFFSMATRVLAELGANLVKCYYCEDFEKVTAGCPVPIVIAGGKLLPTEEALALAYHAIQDGAAGCDMGRNIFQNEDPKAMAKAVGSIIHKGFTDKEALEYYNDIRAR